MPTLLHRAGALHERVSFEKQGTASDGHGGTTSAWAQQFACRAAYVHMRGGESIQAARLAGSHVQVIRVRASPAVAAVTAGWRIRDARTGAVFNIRDVERAVGRRTIDFLCQTGVAT